MHNALFIDAGNTRIKWQVCVFESACGFQEIDSGVIATNQAFEAEPQSRWLTAVLAKSAEAGVRGVVVSSVLGSAWLGRLKTGCAGFTFHAPVVQESNLLQLPYYDSEQLGVDRWLGCLALAAQSTSSVNLMVSFGTATTIDALVCPSDEAGEQSGFVHLGGFIAPGLQVMMGSLSRATQNVDSFPFVPQPIEAWPSNTHQAICSGVQNAQIGLLEHAIKQLGEQFPQDAVAVWVTGGAYSCLNLKRVGCSVNPIPNAIFKGLQQCLKLSL